MTVIDLTSPLTLLLILGMLIFLIILGKGIKKSFTGIIGLVISLALLITHLIQLFYFHQNNLSDLHLIAQRSLAIDFILVFISFIGYLWIDDIESKANNIKSIDNSLDWFWNKL